MTHCVVTRAEQPHLLRGVHSGTCPGQACDGCAPAPALPGLLVCGEHVDDVRGALRDFPTLWAALAEPSTLETDGAGPPGAGDAAGSSLPPAVQARSLIRSSLVTWCKVLEDEHGIPLPDEHLIARRTILDVRIAEWDRDVELDAWRRPVDPTRRAAARQRAAEHDALAAELRRRRAGDVDVIDALREHLDRHLQTLLADHAQDEAGGWEGQSSGYREAQVFAEDVLDVRRRARSIANPRTATARILCTCGSRVAIDTDPNRQYRCPGCAQTGTLDQWRRWEAPHDEPLPLSRLAGWLNHAHGIEVTLGQLRGLRDRGTINALDCCIPQGALGPHRPGCTQQFDPNAVLLVLQHRADRKRAG